MSRNCLIEKMATSHREGPDIAWVPRPLGRSSAQPSLCPVPLCKEWCGDIIGSLESLVRRAFKAGQEGKPYRPVRRGRYKRMLTCLFAAWASITLQKTPEVDCISHEEFFVDWELDLHQNLVRVLYLLPNVLSFRSLLTSHVHTLHYLRALLHSLETIYKVSAKNPSVLWRVLN